MHRRPSVSCDDHRIPGLACDARSHRSVCGVSRGNEGACAEAVQGGRDVGGRERVVR